MSLSRVIEVSFGGGSIAYAKVDTAYFYNNGILFKPTDLDLPASYQVHWADSPDKATTIETIGTSDGAPIPDDLWGRSRVIYGWIYLHPTNDSSITAYEVRIYKNVRAGLPDGTEPTPAEQSTIDQLISALNGAVEQAEDAQEAIENMSVSATTLVEGASATVTKSEQDGVVHLAFGIPKGATGDDGYSPTANVSKSGKTATITITDKNGTTTAQVEDGTDGIDGISPSVSVTDITGGHRVVITDKDGAKSFDVEDGATGATPNLTIGTVETLEPTDDATATITGTAENPVLNFGIPKGEQGEVTLEEFYKAFPTDTASGSIASFPDGADDLPLKSLVVDINPVQDLHGQDAPYPAGGGKNLFGLKQWLDSLNITYTQQGEKFTITSNGSLYTNPWVFSDTDVKVKFSCKSFTNETATQARITFLDTGGNIVSSRYADDVLTLNVTASKCRFDWSSGGTFSIEEAQIELGATATSYAPYENLCPISGWTQVDVNHSDADMTNPTTLTINLGQTVYGGKLDVLSGELVIDRAMVDLGTLEWRRMTDRTYVVFRPTSVITNMKHYPSGTGNPNMICSRYPCIITTFYNDFGDANNDNKLTYVRSGGQSNKIAVQDSAYTDEASFTAAMSGVQLCYELATPIEIQLTPNQVNSLLGVNNIWADSGDTEVVYRADTKLFIERLTAPDSADMIADANITSGQYFMVGNSLYKATANIANGSAIIVGTNAVRKSLSEALNEINA